MGILEHVKELETKVDKEIELAKRLVDEKNQLREENTQLRERVALYQKRIEDLEILIQAFKEEQIAIESGILSALNRLNQFEDAVEKSLSLVSVIPETPETGDSELSEDVEDGEASVTNAEIDTSDQVQVGTE